MGEATCLVTHKLTNDKANTNYPTKKICKLLFSPGTIKNHSAVSNTYQNIYPHSAAKLK